jgi:putative two-component system response regulator
MPSVDVDIGSGRILLVGAGSGALTLESLLRDQSWEHVRIETPSGVLRQVRRDSGTDLVVLTSEESLRPYYELCREIKFDARTALVSVIFVLSPEQAENRTDVFEAGADDCIQLPASLREILLRLSNALRIKGMTDLLEDSTAVVTSLAAAIEGRDAYTHGHVERVSTYSVKIGGAVGVNANELDALRIGGIVHDIGKVAVPDQILNKPGKLDALEMELVKRHAMVGYDVLQPLRTFRDALPIVRWHHERPNGKGYPDGLAGEELPLLPRPAMSPSKCREILSKAADDGDLDNALVAALFAILDKSTPALVGMGAAGPTTVL